MTLLRIIFALWYSLCGYAGFVVFVILKNYPSALLGFLTGSTSGIFLFLHILARRKKLQEWYNSSDLYQLCRLGFVVVTTATLCLVYHSAMEIMLKKEIFPMADSNIICIVWSFLTLKSGLLLMYYSLDYEKQADNQLICLITEEQNHEISTSSLESDQ